MKRTCIKLCALSKLRNVSHKLVVHSFDKVCILGNPKSHSNRAKLVISCGRTAAVVNQSVYLNYLFVCIDDGELS